MQLVDYSEKSFVVYGEDTRNRSKELKELGGRYNPNLTHPETKQKFSGWIFGKKKKEQVEKLMNTPVVVSSINPEIVDTNTSSKLVLKKPVKCVQGLSVANFTYESLETPTMQEIPSFTMIVPKVGLKIKIQDQILEIVETISNKDGYIFEFKAQNKTKQIHFVMIGKEWRECAF